MPASMFSGQASMFMNQRASKASTSSYVCSGQAAKQNRLGCIHSTPAMGLRTGQINLGQLNLSCALVDKVEFFAVSDHGLRT